MWKLTDWGIGTLNHYAITQVYPNYITAYELGLLVRAILPATFALAQHDDYYELWTGYSWKPFMEVENPTL